MNDLSRPSTGDAYRLLRSPTGRNARDRVLLDTPSIMKSAAPSGRVSRSRAMPTGGRRSKPAAPLGRGSATARSGVVRFARCARDADRRSAFQAGGAIGASSDTRSARLRRAVPTGGRRSKPAAPSRRLPCGRASRRRSLRPLPGDSGCRRPGADWRARGVLGDSLAGAGGVAGWAGGGPGGGDHLVADGPAEGAGGDRG